MSDNISVVAPQRKTWVARQAAFIKSEVTDARELPEEKRLAVAAGATLVAMKAGEQGNLLVIAEAELDGEKVPAHLTFINRDHWKHLKAEALTAPAETGSGKSESKGKAKRIARLLQTSKAN